jgi:hypothetical protein
MAHHDARDMTDGVTVGSRAPAVGQTLSGWYAAHACGWIETGFRTCQGATRMLERHIAFVCAAPTCHHP